MNMEISKEQLKTMKNHLKSDQARELSTIGQIPNINMGISKEQLMTMKS